MTLVVDTNVLISLFLPSNQGEASQLWWETDPDWRLPALWICEFRHVHLKYLRAGRIELRDALANLEEAERLFQPQTTLVSSTAALALAHHHGCSSDDAEFVLLAQLLHCPLLTWDRRLLQLFPDLAVAPA